MVGSETMVKHRDTAPRLSGVVSVIQDELRNLDHLIEDLSVKRESLLGALKALQGPKTRKAESAAERRTAIRSLKKKVPAIRKGKKFRVTNEVVAARWHEIRDLLKNGPMTLDQIWSHLRLTTYTGGPKQKSALGSFLRKHFRCSKLDGATNQYHESIAAKPPARGGSSRKQ